MEPLPFSLDIISLIIALFIIVRSSDALVTAALNLSRKQNVPEFVIGLVVVSVGTSLPELFTSVTGSFLGESGVSLGTIIGANMLNICVILGVAILLLGKHSKSQEWVYHGVVLVAVSLLFVTLVSDGLSRAEGATLAIFFVIYVYGLFRFRREHVTDQTEHHVENAPDRHVILDYVILLASGTMLALGSVWLVSSVQKVSADFGIAESVIAALIVAIGTTLPELAVTLQSVKKQATGVLIGNLIGSNISNILLIGGIAAVVRPFAIPDTSAFAMLPFFIIAPLLVMIYLSRDVNKVFGMMLIFLYVAFIIATAFSVSLAALG